MAATSVVAHLLDFAHAILHAKFRSQHLADRRTAKQGAVEVECHQPHRPSRHVTVCAQPQSSLFGQGARSGLYLSTTSTKSAAPFISRPTKRIVCESTRS